MNPSEKGAPRLPPIPTPLRLRLSQYLSFLGPKLMFALVCLACGILWIQYTAPTHFFGQVQIDEIVIAAPDGGLITNAIVRLHETVKAGMVVSELITTDPRTVNSRLAVMRGRMQLTELEMSPILGQQRNALDFAQLSLNTSRLKVELATARVNLERAKAELRRSEKLRETNLISDEALDVYRKAYEAFEAEVREKSILVIESDKTIQRLAHLADTFIPGGENDPLRQAIRVQESQTRALEDKVRPMQLVTPSDGIITAIHHRNGEQVIAGTPIVTITQPKPERILGQLPQGYPFEPVLGMKIRVSTRGIGTHNGWANVIGISPAIATDTNNVGRTASLLPYRSISISMPTNMNLLPGQPVDLFLPAP
jgi:multidrug resistance efflux pump